MQPHPIHKVHTDIWDVIFGYACTDGGQTGAALALTSSSMRKLSTPYRFYSLKLTSLAQVGRLLLCVDRIERSQGPLRPMTAHDSRSVLNAHNLLLSFFPEDCESLVRPWRGWSEYSGKAQKRLNQFAEDERVWETAKGAWDRQFVYLISRLFHLVAPTLRSLAILQHPDIRLPHVDITFPVLREVSLLADDAVLVQPEPQWSDARDPEDIDRDAHIHPRFPSLTHLHVVHEGLKRHSWERTLLLWSVEAPALTHLRVSQASNILPEVLDGQPTRAFQRTKPHVETRQILTHSALRRVIIQPLVLQPVRGHEHLQELSIQSAAPKGSGDAIIVVLRGRWYRAGYWRDRLRWEWEDRMMGRLGCWGEREEDEGEWTHERRKRAETAAQKAGMKKLSAGRAKERIKLNGLGEELVSRWRLLWVGAASETSHGRSASV
ncbi:hypothetical protein ACG7TL_004486 [Trametes sanguinea]